MAPPRVVVQLRRGNGSAIDPATRAIRRLVENALVRPATETKVVRGQIQVEEKHVQYFDYDSRKRIVFPSGLGPRVRHALSAAGYKLKVEDLWHHPKPEVLVPQWDRLSRLNGFQFRPHQRECLETALGRLFGRVSLPPGAGKSALFPLYPILLPKARIHFVTDSATVCKTRIYPSLLQTVADVGMRGAGRTDSGRRVMVYTLDSLHHSDGKADFLIGDEAQDFGAEQAQINLSRYRFSRMHAYSATHNCRRDGMDAAVEALFGPVVYHVTYPEAVRCGMVVPVQVNWRHVYGEDPAMYETRLVEKDRARYWLNDKRNDLVAKDARIYASNVQTLITVTKVQHGIELKKRLPEFAFARRDDDPHDYARLDELEAVGEQPMKSEQLLNLTRAFSAGSVKKAICTGVWNVGVDFPKLQTLVRADGQGSAIADYQIPGRSTRTTKDGSKQVALVHDYADHFAPGPERRSKSRHANYVSYGWEQIGWEGW
jgi:superfamily II DNA or RNA helicase